MLLNLRISIYLWWWSGTKRVSRRPLIRLVRQHVSYGKGVIDLTWKLKCNGQTRYISERANDWNLFDVIRHVEHEQLPGEIQSMKEQFKAKEG